LLFVRLFIYWYLNGYIPPINALAAMFSFMSASLFILFAMWFDMEANKDLNDKNNTPMVYGSILCPSIIIFRRENIVETIEFKEKVKNGVINIPEKYKKKYTIL
jgi:putative Ca2+/H+ antiporter (TMEM165/GDT1 family)